MWIELDSVQLRQLEVDISGAPGRIQRNASRATQRGARLIEREMKVDAAGHGNVPYLPTSVSHELLSPLLAEIGLGPKPGTQGSLAHIIVYGSVNNDPVYNHMAGPLRALPRVEKAYGDAAEKSVLGDP